VCLFLQHTCSEHWWIMDRLFLHVVSTPDDTFGIHYGFDSCRDEIKSQCLHMLAHFGLYFFITPGMSFFPVPLHLPTGVEIIRWKYSAVLWASKIFLLVCVDLVVNSIVLCTGHCSSIYGTGNANCFCTALLHLKEWRTIGCKHWAVICSSWESNSSVLIGGMSQVLSWSYGET